MFFPEIEEVQNFLLLAELAGWVYNSPHAMDLSEQLPGISPVVYYQDGDMEFRDMCYTSNQEAYGMKIISFKNQPIWICQYHIFDVNFGNKELIQFARACRMQAYEKMIFNGGFGPSIYIQNTDSRFIYENEVMGDFETFTGEEKVKGFDGEMEWHNTYSGGMMICRPEKI